MTLRWTKAGLLAGEAADTVEAVAIPATPAPRHNRAAPRATF